VFSINAVLTVILVFALAGLFYERTNQAKAAAALSAATAEYLATTDVLTGLSNRRPLIESLEARGLEGDYTVAIVDMDHFKALNDTFGHQCGDRVLAEVAGRFKSLVREADAVGRWGGEEFIVVLPHTGIEQGAALMERLREHVAHTVIPCTGHDHRVTISIGVADGEGDGMPHHVVKRADDALYDAKVAGRDTVRTRGLAEPRPTESYQENPRASRIRHPGSATGR
jgi:diguanylate cyclase (GGDEF)-like protein